MRHQALLSLSCILLVVSTINAQLPPSFDLRDYSGHNYVTSIKSQLGGTCWTHGAMAAMESNLLMTGTWMAAGESGEPNLAEYHLDWWNGFNKHNNDDTYPATGGGLTVHQGGDYLVTSAYLSRGEGAVRDMDGQSYSSPPPRCDSSFHYYYPRDIVWMTAGPNLTNIDYIKNAIMTHGAVGTCMCYNIAFMHNYIHYQEPTSTLSPNHAITIIGWDDNKITQAPHDGAWLCKNSWGEDWGEEGCFWISYYDKYCCQDPQMGAISFQDVEPLPYDKIYYHDYHGWRDTKADCQEAFNAFLGLEYSTLTAVSFYTATDDVEYTVKVYDDFIEGQLQGELSAVSGVIESKGFHTVDLVSPVGVVPDDDFYLYLFLSDGGQPFDRTSEVPVLLGASYKATVESTSEPGQSFYLSGQEWVDFYEDDTTANFCMKALAVRKIPLNFDFPAEPPEYLAAGQQTTFQIEIRKEADSVIPGSAKLHFRNLGEDFSEYPIAQIDTSFYQAMLPPASCRSTVGYYFSAETQLFGTVCYPADAPQCYFTARAGEIVTIWHDDFETDQGWVGENLGAVSGDWQRGVPVNDPAYPYDPEADSDGDGQCFLTGNYSGDSDVDYGAARITSPVFEMDEYSTINYDYYLYLSAPEYQNDLLLVEISDDAGISWTEIHRHESNGGTFWQYHEITADEIATAGVTPCAHMKIRFTANDDYPEGVVEAGLDNFTVNTLYCLDYGCGDANRDGDANIGDAVYLLNNVFHDGPEPEIFGSGDTNCDLSINIGDAIYLLNFIFKGGPHPCTNCPK